MWYNLITVFFFFFVSTSKYTEVANSMIVYRKIVVTRWLVKTICLSEYFLFSQGVKVARYLFVHAYMVLTRFRKNLFSAARTDVGYVTVANHSPYI